MTKITYELHLQGANYYFDSIEDLKHYMTGKGLKPYIHIGNIQKALGITIIVVYPIFLE